VGEPAAAAEAHLAAAVPRLAGAIDADPPTAHARLYRLALAAGAAASTPPPAAFASWRRRYAMPIAGVVILLACSGYSTALVVRTGGSAAPMLPGDGGTGGSMGRVFEEGQPETVPGGPYTLVYENVRVRIPNPQSPRRCGHILAVSLHDPERVGSYPFDDRKAHGDIEYAADCRGTTWMSLLARGVPATDAGVGPEQCADLVLADPHALDGFHDVKVRCLIAEADAERGRPLLLVRLVTRSDELGEAAEWTATAWTGASVESVTGNRQGSGETEGSATDGSDDVGAAAGQAGGNWPDATGSPAPGEPQSP
jgi:hypothetical protein